MILTDLYCDFGNELLDSAMSLSTVTDSIFKCKINGATIQDWWGTLFNSGLGRQLINTTVFELQNRKVPHQAQF